MRKTFDGIQTFGRAFRMARFSLPAKLDGPVLTLDRSKDDEDIGLYGCNGCAGVGRRAWTGASGPTSRICRWPLKCQRTAAGRRRRRLLATTRKPRCCSRPGRIRTGRRDRRTRRPRRTGRRGRGKPGPGKAVASSRTAGAQGTGDPAVRLARTGRDLQLAQPHESLERAGRLPTTAATSMR